MGLIHGQFSPQYMKVNKYYLYGKEYVYSGQNNMNNGWTVDGGSPQLDLFLQSHYLITGISFRACTGKQCPLPTVFRVVMWNNADSWIYLKYTTKDGIYSVGVVFSLPFCSVQFFVGVEGLSMDRIAVVEL